MITARMKRVQCSAVKSRCGSVDSYAARQMQVIGHHNGLVGATTKSPFSLLTVQSLNRYSLFLLWLLMSLNVAANCVSCAHLADNISNNYFYFGLASVTEKTEYWRQEMREGTKRNKNHVE